MQGAQGLGVGLKPVHGVNRKCAEFEAGFEAGCEAGRKNRVEAKCGARRDAQGACMCAGCTCMCVYAFVHSCMHAYLCGVGGSVTRARHSRV